MAALAKREKANKDTMLELTVVLVRWFLCTRFTFWKVENWSKLNDLTERTETDEPEDTDETPETK